MFVFQGAMMPPTIMSMPPQMVPPPPNQHNINPNMIGGPPGMPPMMPPVMNPSILPNRGPGLPEDHRGVGGVGTNQQMDKRNEQPPQGWRSRDTREKERDYRERDRKLKLLLIFFFKQNTLNCCCSHIKNR